ncbi:MAG: hypothetical protein R3E44_05815 [Paracoccaceae bacterium]
MRVILWVVVLALLVAVIAWLTRPDIRDFDATLKTQVESLVAKTDVGDDGDPVATLALVGCKLRPTDCFDVIRETLDVQMEDRGLYTRFMVKGLGRETTCTGAFTKIWCARPILKD